jgi:hypothetical protein
MANGKVKYRTDFSRTPCIADPNHPFPVRPARASIA